jgi:hypothetical protein
LYQNQEITTHEESLSGSLSLSFGALPFLLSTLLTSCPVSICQTKEYMLMSSFEEVPNEKAGRKLE